MTELAENGSFRSEESRSKSSEQRSCSEAADPCGLWEVKDGFLGLELEQRFEMSTKPNSFKESLEFFSSVVQKGAGLAEARSPAAKMVVAGTCSLCLLTLSLTAGMPWWASAPAITGICCYGIFKIRDAPNEE